MRCCGVASGGEQGGGECSLGAAYPSRFMPFARILSSKLWWRVAQACLPGGQGHVQPQELENHESAAVCRHGEDNRLRKQHLCGSLLREACYAISISRAWSSSRARGDRAMRCMASYCGRVLFCIGLFACEERGVW